MNLIDAIGVRHVPIQPSRSAPRIVSLVPSITELLCDLGLTQWLVGRTGFCIHPAGLVRAIAKVGGTKDVNLEKVRALAPTHLIVNIDENEKPAVDALAQFVPNVIVTHPQQPRDNLGLYLLLGGIFRAEQKALALCAAFEREYAALAAAPKGAPSTVLYCIWKDPWMTIGRDTYIAHMLEQIGWRQWLAPDAANAAGGVARYPRFEWSEQLLRTIDTVLLSSEPYRFTAAHVETLQTQLGTPVRLIDGEMVSWYGSRAIAGLRYLRALTSAGRSGPASG